MKMAKMRNRMMSLKVSQKKREKTRHKRRKARTSSRRMKKNSQRWKKFKMTHSSI